MGATAVRLACVKCAACEDNHASIRLWNDFQILNWVGKTVAFLPRNLSLISSLFQFTPHQRLVLFVGPTVLPSSAYRLGAHMDHSFTSFSSHFQPNSNCEDVPCRHSRTSTMLSPCLSTFHIHDVHSFHAHVASIHLPTSRLASTDAGHAHRLRSSLPMIGVVKHVVLDPTLVFVVATLWIRGQPALASIGNEGGSWRVPRGGPLWIRNTHRANLHGATRRRRRRSATQGTKESPRSLHARRLDVGRPGRT